MGKHTKTLCVVLRTANWRMDGMGENFCQVNLDGVIVNFEQNYANYSLQMKIPTRFPFSRIFALFDITPRNLKSNMSSFVSFDSA